MAKQQSARDVASATKAHKTAVGAVILAAGSGQRFGSDKRQASLHGRPVIEQTLDRYQQAFSHLRLVVRPEDEIFIERYADVAEIIVADDAHMGMGHSLARGFMQLTWGWTFIGLADMPFIQPSSLLLLMQRCQGSTAKILRPRYMPSSTQENPAQLRDDMLSAPHGHPIAIHQSLYQEVLQLKGDQGARPVIQRHQQHAEDVWLDDPGVIQDIDYPGDLTHTET